MPENLKLFAERTPETFEEAWRVIQEKVESTKDDGKKIPNTQTPSVFVRALINLLSKQYMSDGDIELLNRFVNRSSEDDLRKISEELDVNESEIDDIKSWINTMIAVSVLFVLRHVTLNAKALL